MLILHIMGEYELKLLYRHKLILWSFDFYAVFTAF